VDRREGQTLDRWRGRPQFGHGGAPSGSLDDIEDHPIGGVRRLKGVGTSEHNRLGVTGSGERKRAGRVRFPAEILEGFRGKFLRGGIDGIGKHRLRDLVEGRAREKPKLFPHRAALKSSLIKTNLFSLPMKSVGEWLEESALLPSL
jgi:hypothetical protein